MSETTRILERAEQGDAQAAADLLPLVYNELRKLAASRLAREAQGATLQATALVHEAWLRLGGDPQAAWQNRAHFFGAAAEAMRRILIDRARRRKVRQASGLDAPEELLESRIEWRVPADELLAVNDALEELAVVDAVAARLVKLRFFAGLEMTETAHVLGLSLRATERLWTFSRAWLRDRMEKNKPAERP